MRSVLVLAVLTTVGCGGSSTAPSGDLKVPDIPPAGRTVGDSQHLPSKSGDKPVKSK